MAGSGRQLRLLMWKNWRLQKKKVILTLFEIGLPALFTLILLLVRTRVESEYHSEPTTWNVFSVGDSLPSELTPQSVLCNNTNSQDRRFLLAHVPNTAVVRRLVDRVASRLDLWTEGLGFDTEAQLETYMQQSDPCWKIDVLAGVVITSQFPSDDVLPGNVTYKLRPPSEQQFGRTGVIRFVSSSEWYTSFSFPGYTVIGPRETDEWNGGTPGYYREGFLAIQRAVDLSIMSEWDPDITTDIINMELKRHPYPAYSDDSYVNVLQTQFPFIVMLSFIVAAPNISKDICLEKEKKLKELMKMMGLKNWLHWLAWFIKFSIFMTLSCALMTLFLHVKTQHGAVINYTDPTVTFVFLWLYSIATIMFCFAASTFFSTANGGAAGGGIGFLLSYFPFFFFQVRMSQVTAPQKAGASILHNLAMGFGCTILAQFEGRGVGIQWSNIHIPYSPENNFTMLHVFLFLILDCMAYGLVTWYFDGILPGKHGIPKPPYFPFTKSYWCGKSSSTYHHDIAEPYIGDKSEYFEPYNSNHKAGIQIRNLKKVYNSGKKNEKQAVAGLSLDMLDGQITSLLGHNGAGKTTTISMLTGFLPPTDGTAYVSGYNIISDMDRVRESLGLCPQHDVLFDTLTVKEHLIFYAKLRGASSKMVTTDVYKMIDAVHLEEKTSTESRHLSGGQKRKLSVGIALVAGAQFVILDEPTSGMDPEARRQTWDLLKAQCNGRTILLTTHSMDEADFLGDRIAIMAAGTVQCCGSSMFLKNKYGIGYHLVTVKEPNCDVDKVIRKVTSFVPEAKLENNVGAELSFTLPRHSCGLFHGLFSYLENNRLDLGISSFGASITTLEEVFLKVGESNNESQSNKLRGGHGPQYHSDLDVDTIKKDTTASDDISSKSPIADNSNSNSPAGGCLPTHKADNSNSSSPAGGCLPTHKAVAPVLDPYYSNGGVPNMAFDKEYADHDTVVNDTSDEDFPHQPDSQKVVFDTTKSHKRSSVSGSSESNVTMRLTGLQLTLQQFKAMLVKRMIHTSRNKVVTVVQTLIPIVFAIAACAVLVTMPGPRDPPPYELTVNHFNDPISPYMMKTGDDSDILLNLTDKYLKVLADTKVEKAPLVNNEDWYTTNTSMDDYLSRRADDDFDEFTRDQMTAVTFADDKNPNTTITGHFNNEALHTPAISLNLITNTMAKYFISDTHAIHVTNHPLPRDAAARVEEELNTSFAIAFIIAYSTSFGMAFLTSTFVLFVIKERRVKSKLIQFVSGVHQANYWLSTFLWDLVNYLIPAAMLICIYLAFGIEAYSTSGGVGVMSSAFLLYAWAILPCTYLLSFAFDVPASGYRALTIINIITGTTAIVTVGILKSPELDLEDVAIILEWFCYALLPNFAFGNIIGNLFVNYEAKLICTSMETDLNTTNEQFCTFLELLNTTNPCCPETCGYYCAYYTDSMFAMAHPGAGRGLTFLAGHGIIFFFILFLIESNWAHQVKQRAAVRAGRAEMEVVEDEEIRYKDMELDTPDYDSEIQAEEQRIRDSPLDQLLNSDALVLRDLTKYYGSLKAVNGLSIGVGRGELFGLLGVNGAGKTSTFKMLTGDETVSVGEAYMAGYSVIDDIKKVHQRLGYCPQFDALIDQMTVRETLRMYARLRGMEEHIIPVSIHTLMEELSLTEHADMQAGQLSGGNKRKLSTAIALVGDPPLVFLDEPTTGMDPVARRLIWDALTEVCRRGKTIILTSHSMEECEALCTKLVIMVNGQFRCLGSIQHLKTKFGEGYTLIAKLRAPDTTKRLSDNMVKPVNIRNMESEGGSSTVSKPLNSQQDSQTVYENSQFTDEHEIHDHMSTSQKQSKIHCVSQSESQVETENGRHSLNGQISELSPGIDGINDVVNPNNDPSSDASHTSSCNTTNNPSPVSSRYPGDDLLEIQTRALMTFIEDSFPGSHVKDQHAGLVQYEISNQHVTWADVFQKMEHAREAYNLEDYSVSQTSLEQVFLNFARSQLPPEHRRSVGCCVRCRYCCGGCTCDCSCQCKAPGRSKTIHISRC